MVQQTSYEKCAVWALLTIICDTDGLICHSEPGGMSLGVFFSHQRTKMLNIKVETQQGIMNWNILSLFAEHFVLFLFFKI